MLISELDQEQVAFLAFCNLHYKDLTFMATSGVWDIHSGNAILSFDAEGRLKTIKRELFTYQKP